jgi:hypothetical protein
MKIQVHFNDYGQIVSVVQLYKAVEDRPPAGVLTPSGVRMLETELAGKEAEEPLIVVHTGHIVDVESGKLVSIRKRQKRKRGS